MLHRRSSLFYGFVRCSRSYSSFLSGPSWSIRSLVPKEEAEELIINENDIKQCGLLSKLSSDVSEQTIEGVKQIIRCSSRISKVDVSKEKFKLTDIEKECGKVFGMISPITEQIRCRLPNDPSGQANGGFADSWALESMKQNASRYKQMEGNFIVVPTISKEDMDE